MTPLWLLFLGIVLVVSQPHNPPVAEVHCYDCGGHGHKFPECLNHVKTCHHDEICQFRYGAKEPEIHCRDQEDCDQEVTHAHHQCSLGGASVHEACQVCCQNNHCLSQTLNIIDGQTGVTKNGSVHCPANCILSNLDTCLQGGTLCHDQQFCAVTKDEQKGVMHGICKDMNLIENCNSGLGSCDQGNVNCLVGCCADDKCISSAFGAKTSSMWELLKGDCQDQMDAALCSQMDTTQHLCNDRLALRLCPKSCGLCSAFHIGDCQDTVMNDGCKGLQTTDNICSNPMAVNICPVTCGMCDQLLELKIQAALASAQTPSTTLAPVATTTTLPAASSTSLLTCADLAGQNCSYLFTICASVNCPQECNACLSVTAAPMPSTQDAMITGDLFSTDMITNSPVVTDTFTNNAQTTGNAQTTMDAFTNNAQTTDNAQTTMDAFTSDSHTNIGVGFTTGGPASSAVSTETPKTAGSTAVNVAIATTEACEDTIPDMSCSDVQDVCATPQLVGYCRKFCGLC